MLEQFKKTYSKRHNKKNKNLPYRNNLKSVKEESDGSDQKKRKKPLYIEMFEAANAKAAKNHNQDDNGEGNHKDTHKQWLNLSAREYDLIKLLISKYNEISVRLQEMCSCSYGIREIELLNYNIYLLRC